MTLLPAARTRAALRNEKLLQRVPTALIEYPLEVLLAAWGILSAPPILLGLTAAPSIARLLPTPFAYAWASVLFISSVTIAVGLRYRHYGTTVARGLELLGVACLCYALAIFAIAGWRRGIPVGPLVTVIAGLCLLRAWWLRELRRILIRVDREASR